MATLLPAPTSQRSWAEDLAFETALGYFTPEELCLRHNISSDRLQLLSSSDVFKRAVSEYRRQIDESGALFQVKARRMASEALEIVFDLAANPAASDADRLRAVQDLCRYAGFDKGVSSGGDGKPGTGFVLNIQINNP